MGDLMFWAVVLGSFAGLFLLKRLFDMPLWVRVLAGLVAGGAVGFIFANEADQIANIKYIGDGFIKLIRMLIVPLIFTTIVSGIIAMGDPKRLGSLGGKTIFLYMLTTMFAVVVGLIFGTIFQPGVGADLSNASSEVAGDLMTRVDAAREVTWQQQILDIIPSNPVKAMVDGDVLPIIFFSILFGINAFSRRTVSTILTVPSATPR